MKKYEWDLDYLYKMKNSLFEMINKANNTEEEDILLEALSTYDDIISNYDIRIGSFFDDEDYIYDEKRETSVSKFKKNTYNKIGSNKISLVTNSIDVAKNYILPFSPHNRLPNSLKNITNEDLVEIANEIYKKIPVPSFYQEFLDIINSDKHLLHIKYYKKVPIDYYGLTHNDPYNHISYGLISRYNNIGDIITLVHECAHMIVRKYMTPFYMDSNKTIYGEVEGCFANLLATYYLKEMGFDKNDLDSWTRFDLQFNIDRIIQLYIMCNIIKNTDNFDKTNFRKITQELENVNIKTPISKKNYFEFLTDIGEDIDNVVSYLVALDLYSLYLFDPEKAIYSLMQIPNLAGNNPRKELSKIDVTFFQDGYQNLNNHCQKILKK